MLDLCTAELYKEGKRIKLQEQPWQVLAQLIERPGELVTREELKKKLWPNDTFVDFDHGVNIAVNKLRDALGDSAENPHFIETLPRRGYRFIAPVSNEIASQGADTPAHASSAQPLRITPRRVLAFLAIAAAAVALIFAIDLGRVRKRLGDMASSQAIKSLAVLPLHNLSHDPEQEYFTDGMTDQLITNLAKLGTLRVISRTSVEQYKETKRPMQEIARELSVDVVVEGAVLRSGDRVRITAQLIEARSDRHLWAETYARDLRDVLALQDEVARDIAAEIGVKLRPQDQARQVNSRPIDPETHELYLRGIYLKEKETPDDVRGAIGYFQKAIGKDRGYAAAYTGLADCYIFLSIVNEMPSAEGFARAKEAAEKAGTLDDKLDDAHVEMAYVAAEREWDWKKAEREFQRAIELNPNSARARQGYSYSLLFLGRLQESTEQIRTARALDPLSLPTLVAVSYNAYYRRQYDEALVQTRAALELHPNAPLLHIILSNIYAQQGRYKLASEETLKGEELWGAPPQRMAELRAANEASELKGLLRKRIELNKELMGTPSFSAFDIASDCAAVGDKDQALHWLKDAYRVRDSKLTAIGLDPVFDTLRSDPRYIDLSHRIGLPPLSRPEGSPRRE
ncbi:MAG: hypothetical protein PVS2B2_20970 [Candidatus Acidiferrum sp.]